MTLTCYRCGRTAGSGARCDCGEPLWLATDPADFSWPDGDADGPGTRGVWRYADLLPVDPLDGVGTAAGATPLVRVPRLDESAGCRLWLKDESENPTGSFKDRGSAVGVAAAASAGDDRVGTVSHGNMATSMAANAASAGLPCLVLVPEDIPPERLGYLAAYDPDVVRVAGDYGRLYYESLDLSGVRFVNSDTPYRVAGQKTTALEICEQFRRTGPDAPDADGGSSRSSPARSEALGEGTAPDAVVLPVSSGGHASATWKALRELEAAGLLEDVPRLYLVQAAACDPIAEAYRDGADEVGTAEAGETVAYSIANPDPPSGTRALTAVRETGGAVVSVPDEEILDAKRALARRAGFCVEPASATALAGVRRLSTDGAVARDDHVVAIATGTGFREPPDAGVDPPSVALDDLDESVSALLSG
ncbi:threonine synthase [Halomicrococcus sp. SG-WS-1]|uniref:threonine synthase n=1 Tax=Halomicrococcus sp. SG-WS-1 TaxID=3439057 RepID=UPI003F7995D0